MICIFHKWSKWQKEEIIKCEVFQKKLCDDCGLVQYKKIITKHDWDKWTIVQADYLTGGNITMLMRKCRKCALIEKKHLFWVKDLT